MRRHYIKKMAGAVALVCIAAVGIAGTDCMNMDPSTQSMPNCVTCTTNGPVAGNENGSCAYQVETQGWGVFCYCNPDYNCISAGAHIGEVLLNFSGICVSGACVYVVQQPSNYGEMLQKGVTKCYPKG